MPAGSSAHRTAFPPVRSVSARSADLRALTIATAVLGVVATVVVAASPAVRFAYEAPSLHVFLETTAGLIALLAAYLVFGRFRDSSRLDDLVLSCGLAVLSASSLLFHTLPAASGLDAGRFATWAPLVGRVLGALLLTGAAFSSARRIRHPRRSAVTLFGAAGLLLAAVGLFVAVLADHLPVGVDPSLSPPDALGRPQISGHPALLAAQLLCAALYAVAAVGFTRRAESTNDDLLRWFSTGCILASVAAMHYFLFPSLYSRWVYTGDVARLLAHLALLAGAAREIGRYWKSVATVAVLEERRRIARDLHDGLAQELAYIIRQAHRAEHGGTAVDREITQAAERAIADARFAIAALTRPLDEPLDVALVEAVEQVADRLGQKIVLEVQPNVRVDPLTRQELVRIAREAVANAARHGRADTVRLELSNGGRIRLRIADDGVGFEPNRVDRRKQFGILGMRERARALDADFRLASAPGRGTEIEVILP
jgi:signal transduction histidine kinase